MTPDYDKIASYYDLLSRIIFGNTIKRAQTDLLGYIPAGCNILIAGGGTGWILEEISAIHSSGLIITYIDASKKMIERSEKRNSRSNKLNFISQRFEALDAGMGKYDVIITPFFLDNFPQKKCEEVLKKLHISLKNDGIWLFTDFRVSRKGNFWQKPLLKIMYLFFRIVCRLEASQLPDTDRYFSAHRYKKVAEKRYCKGFITSIVFKKKI